MKHSRREVHPTSLRATSKLSVGLMMWR